MRGKQKDADEVPMATRITPACAGKTCILADDNLIREDHPRVCGENSSLQKMGAPQAGSPPRVRGKHVGLVKRATRSRITPACAGKTDVVDVMWASPEDPPRVCGENRDPDNISAAKKGSPPRVRGKRAWRISQSTGSRITPACAGKTKRG